MIPWKHIMEALYDVAEAPPNASSSAPSDGAAESASRDIRGDAASHSQFNRASALATPPPESDQAMTDQPTPEEDLFPGASSTSSDAVHSPAANSAASTSAPPHALAANQGATVGTTTTTTRQGQHAPVKHVHKPTGYTWEKDEDAPGYGWKNKKAQDEMARALDSIVDKDKIIGRKYGDIGADRIGK